MVMIKRTFTSDDDLNMFFANTPNCYLVKFIVTNRCGVEVFHLIYIDKKRNANIVGKEHLQRGRQIWKQTNP
jgi:hypothetical protein